MSISSMTNIAFVRRAATSAAFASITPHEQSLTAEAGAQTAPAGQSKPGPSMATLEQATAAPSASQSSGTVLLKAVATYIPSEILTLYVAVVAVLAPVKDPTHIPDSAWATFAIFLILTPVVVWLTFATKIKNAGGALPISPHTWPMWEMSAATIAYFAWAFALPASPFIAFQDVYSPSLAGLLVTCVTAALGLLGPVMSKPLPKA
jgi:hypothetical protein